MRARAKRLTVIIVNYYSHYHKKYYRYCYYYRKAATTLFRGLRDLLCLVTPSTCRAKSHRLSNEIDPDRRTDSRADRRSPIDVTIDKSSRITQLDPTRQRVLSLFPFRLHLPSFTI